MSEGKSLIVAILVPLVAAAQLGCGESDNGASSSAALSWEDQYDSGTVDGAPGHPRTYDEASDIAVCDARVFATGVSALNDNRIDVITRAYEAEDGSVLWRDRVDGGWDARGIVCNGEQVVVSYVVGARVTLRAYDAASGDVLWATRYEDRYGANITSMVMEGDDVFVAITAYDEPQPGTDVTETPTALIARAVDARSGALLWENQSEGSQPGAYVTLAVGGTRVCSVGDTPLMCFERADGALRWSADVGDTMAFSADASVLAIGSQGGGHVWAYSASDGELLWQREGFSWTTSIAVSEDQFFFAGVQFTVDNGGREDDILAIDARNVRTGALMWEDRAPREQASAAVVQGQLLFVATRQWASRVYNVRSSEMLASVPAGSFPSYRRMAALAAEGNRYFLVGQIENMGDFDFGVSVYVLR